MKRFFFLLVTLPLIISLKAQEVLPLYKGTIPLSKPAPNREESYLGSDDKERIRKVSVPTLAAFLPSKEKSNGMAVIICPGGGYEHLSVVGEGYDVAKLLNEWGVAAFVLKYRMPDDSTMQQKEIGPLQDAQRAIQLVRLNARQWNINPGKVGIMGFSAGGHLAASVGTHFNQAVIPNKEKINLRPDFLVLAYPAISVPDSLSGLDRRMLGKNASPEKVQEYLKGFIITKQTPPAFLVHAKDDKTVNVINSISFYEKLQQNGVKAEIHLYEKGGHGFGINNKMSDEKWTDWLKTWLQQFN